MGGSHGWAVPCHREPLTDALLSLGLEEGMQRRDTKRDLRAQLRDSCRSLQAECFVMGLSVVGTSVLEH